MAHQQKNCRIDRHRGWETRWIESESLKVTGGAHDDDDEDDNDDDDDDENVGLEELGDLFSDPDPYDEFVLNEKEWSLDAPIVLQGIKAENGQTLHSTGLTIWRASHLLCQYLKQNQADMVKDKKILELGAGLGMCGILAHRLGAKCVVLTDGDSNVLQQMRSNVQQNMSEKTRRDSCQCWQLIWGNHHLEAFQTTMAEWTRDEAVFPTPKPHGGNSDTQYVTTRSTADKEDTTIDDNDKNDEYDKQGRFDMIMGSDIIYVEEILEPLFETVNQLLRHAAPSSSFVPTFVLAYARRNVPFDRVIQTAQTFGFALKTSLVGGEGIYEFVRQQDTGRRTENQQNDE